MNVGISTACFYPMPTEETPRLLKECGTQVCEVFLETISEYKSDYTIPLKEELDKNGITPISCHGISGLYEPMIFTDYVRRTDDCIKLFEMHAKAAAALGAKYVTFHGTRTPTMTNTFDYEKFAKRMDILNRICEDNGVIFTWENVSWCQSHDPEFIKKSVEYMDHTQYFTLDIKQAVRAGRSPFEYIDVMQDKIVNFHINDHDATHDCLLPGQGTCDFVSIVNKMKSYGYNGDCIIEVYGSNYKDYSEIRQSVTHLEKILSAI